MVLGKNILRLLPMMVITLVICQKSYAPDPILENKDKFSGATNALFEYAWAIAKKEGAAKLNEGHILKAMFLGPAVDNMSDPVKENRALMQEVSQGFFGKVGLQLTDQQVKLYQAFRIPDADQKATQTELGTEVPQIFERALVIAQRETGDKKVYLPHVLMAIAELDSTGGKFLRDRKLSSDMLMRIYLGAIPAEMSDEKDMFTLEKYGRELVQLARDGKIDPAIGRDRIILNILRTALKRDKKNTLLLGEAGVGKTQVVEGLAHLIAHNLPPEMAAEFKDTKIYAIDLGALVAGGKMRGEVEARIKQILAEAKASEGKTILFIDEAHLMMTAGGERDSTNIANLIKTSIDRGEVIAVAATTVDEAERTLKKDGAILRRFREQLVPPLTNQETKNVLLGSRGAEYEIHHGVGISREAFIAAVDLSDRFVHGRYQPDKAITIIDDAAASLRLEHKGVQIVPPEIEAAKRKLEGLQARIEAIPDIPANETQIAALRAEAEQHRELVDAWETAWQETQRELKPLLELDNKIRALEMHVRGPDPLKADGTGVVGADRRAQLARLGINVPEDATEAAAHLAVATEIEENKRDLADKEKVMEPHRKRFGLGHTRLQPIHVARAVAETADLPLDVVHTEDATRIQNAESELKKIVKHQDEAIHTVSRALKRRASGMAPAKGPIGAFMFLSPKGGTGKTLLAESLAELVFGDPGAIAKINMARITDVDKANWELFGVGAGYRQGEDKEGQGKITGHVRNRPYSVVLLDDIQGVSREVLEMFLDVLEKGWMMDNQGRKVDFTNTIFVLNGNLTEEQAREKFGDPVMGRLRVVTFKDLTQEQFGSIVDGEFERYQRHWSTQGISNIRLGDSARNELARIAKADNEGGRRVRVAIEDKIIDELAAAKLEGRIPKDKEVVITWNEGEGKFEFEGLCAHTVGKVAGD